MVNFDAITDINPTQRDGLSQYAVYKYLEEKFSMIKSKTWKAELSNDSVRIWYHTTYDSGGRICLSFNVSKTCVFNIRVEFEPILKGEKKYSSTNSFILFGEDGYDPRVRFTPEMYKRLCMWLNHLHNDGGYEIMWDYNAVLFDLSDWSSLVKTKSIDKNTSCIFRADLLYDMSAWEFAWLTKNSKQLPPIYFITSYDRKTSKTKEVLTRVYPTDGETVFHDLKVFTLYQKHKRIGYGNSLHLPMTYSLWKLDIDKADAVIREGKKKWGSHSIGRIFGGL